LFCEEFDYINRNCLFCGNQTLTDTAVGESKAILRPNPKQRVLRTGRYASCAAAALISAWVTYEVWSHYLLEGRYDL
jgi:hypothetical protein